MIHEAMSIEQLVCDKKSEATLEEFERDLMNFKLTDEPSDKEDEISPSHAVKKEACIWGLRYIGTGPLSLPDV